MFEAKVSATCRFHTGFTGSPDCRARPEQRRAEQARRPAPSARALKPCRLLLLPQLCQVSEARARGFLLARLLLLLLGHVCPPLSLSLSLTHYSWPGDKFLLLVKQVIKVDLSTMGSFYTLPATVNRATL